MSDDEIFQKALNDAYQKLDAMLSEQAELDQRRIKLDREIARWSEKIVHLAALVDDIPEESNVGLFMKARKEMGLTNAIREVLKASKKPLMPTQVRDALIKAGFDVSEYQNILAAIHITLNRLVGSKEAIESKEDGNKVYSWNPNAPVSTWARLWLEASKTFLDSENAPTVPTRQTSTVPRRTTVPTREAVRRGAYPPPTARTSTVPTREDVAKHPMAKRLAEKLAEGTPMEETLKKKK